MLAHFVAVRGSSTPTENQPYGNPHRFNSVEFESSLQGPVGRTLPTHRNWQQPSFALVATTDGIVPGPVILHAQRNDGPINERKVSGGQSRAVNNRIISGIGRRYPGTITCRFWEFSALGGSYLSNHDSWVLSGSFTFSGAIIAAIGSTASTDGAKFGTSFTPAACS